MGATRHAPPPPSRGTPAAPRACAVLASCLRHACNEGVTTRPPPPTHTSAPPRVGDEGREGREAPPPHEDKVVRWGGSGERVRDGPHDRARRKHAPCKPQRGGHRGCERRVGRATTGATRQAPPPPAEGQVPRLVPAPCLRRAYANVGYSLCLTPGQLQTYTTIDSGASKGVWFKAGAMIFESYLWICKGAPALVSAQSILAELASQVVMMGAIEAHRVNGGPFGGRDLDLVYPSGKQFDPLGFADDPDTAAELNENKKGRLAMLSLFGCYVQAAVPGQGPVEHWASQNADPFAVNVLTLEIIGQYTPYVAMFTDAGKQKEPQVY